jgi:hydrogenase maturation protease
MLTPGVRVLECDGAATSLLEAWQGEEHVILVDAMCSGGEPGVVHRLEASAGPLPATLFRGSTHGLGLAEAVELARALGALPPGLVIYGVEACDFRMGSRPTHEVECGVREAALQIADEVRAWRRSRGA